ncbi:MAG: exodeoxyribonuclease VII small subunit [Planctomycetes bacterium]|nr:exodeoxyribonuclease VII small subunit [Planctomycetota bacterium]
MSEAPEGTPPVSFETALAQLQDIVNDLEEGELGLEPSLARFEEGIRLLRNCYQILEQAEQKIELLTGQDASGQPVTVPFDATATFEAGEKTAKKPGRRRGAAKTEAAPPASPEPDPEDRTGGSLF